MIEDKIKYSKMKNLYMKLPTSGRKIIGTFYSKLPNSLKYGRYYNTNLKNLNKIIKNKNLYEQIIKEKLINILFIAKYKVPFYMEQLKIVNDEELKNYPYEVLNSLPYITKKQVKNNKDDFLNIDKKIRRKIVRTTTSGSSGNPMDVFYEAGKTKALELSTLHFFWNYFLNINPKELSITLRGNLPINAQVYEYEPIKNSIIINPNKISIKFLDEIVKIFKNYRISYIEAYYSNIALLTELLEGHGINVNQSLKGILLGSEEVMDTKKIEDYWKAPVYSWYGHSENILLAPWDKEKKYIFLENIGIVKFDEIQKDIYEIIGSSVDNEVWVLLNYRTGDLANGVYYRNKDNNFSYCRNIFGRKSYHAINKNNEKISIGPLLFGIHNDILNLVDEYQIIQKEKGKLKIIVKISKLQKINLKEKKMLEKILLTRFEDFDLEFDYSGEMIRVESSGKKLVFINFL